MSIRNSQWRFLLFSALLISGLSLSNCSSTSIAPTRDEFGYPQAKLANRALALTVYLPGLDGFYRGPRFDWSGIISRVDYQGHSLFAPRKPLHNPLLQDSAFGTPDEFGMDAALNYNETAPGQPFVKIGVGTLLRIDSADYEFNREYPILTAAPWTNEIGAAFIESTQTQPILRGFGYRYTKRIELIGDDAGFIITRTLTNTGTKEIDTGHYCHNFLIVNDLPIGPGYSIEYPVAPKIHPNSLTQDSISVKDKSIAFDRPVQLGKPVWAPLDGLAIDAPYRMTLHEASTGLTLEIRGDRPLTKAVLYAENRDVCPEAFITLHLRPGETKKWRTEYRLKIAK